MNRRFGLSAGGIALAAFAIHLMLPTAQDTRGQTGSRSADKPQDQTNPNSDDTENSPDPADGPWLATRAFFQSTASIGAPHLAEKRIDLYRAADVSDCSLDGVDKDTLAQYSPGCGSMLAGYFGIKNPETIRFILAAVPDPLHTRLSLGTDTSVQAIQKAAADAGWQFATQWLPWQETIDPNEKDPSKRAEERLFLRKRERQPGVLVYRSKFGVPAVLMIFLVGETPTAGVNPSQFKIARAYMRSIHETQPVRVMGPTFSGGLYSLDKLIDEDWLSGHPNGTKEGKRFAYLIRSGTVTDVDSGQKFAERVDFRSANADSSLSASPARRFNSLQQTLEALNIDVAHAAILVEDESAYGTAVIGREAPGKNKTGGSNSKGPEVFRFPRDISHLRNAYRETTPASVSVNGPEPDLDFSIKDPDVGEDTIPSFSKTQSPLSQNAILSAITSAIRRDRIRIVQINATNVLDLLFLARILKKQCPDTRLLVAYPDLLFVRAAQTEALTGTLALSHYPFFAASNAWMGKPGSPVTFSDTNAEGIYSASMALLSAGPRTPGLDPQIAAKLDRYLAYDQTSFLHPPTWLLTLDRDGFLPLWIWPDNGKWFSNVPDSASQDVRQPSPPVLWILVSALMASLSIAMAAWIVCLSRNETLIANASFSVDTIDQNADRRRLFYIFLLGLLLTAMQFVLYSPMLGRTADWPRFATEVLPLSGILASAMCAVFPLWRYAGKDRESLIGVGAALAAFLAIPTLWILCYAGRPEAGFFFLFRTLESRVGSSPAWPVMASLGVLTIFSVVHLSRLYLSVYEKPAVEVDNIETILREQIRISYSRFNESAESLLGIWKESQWKRAAVTLGLAAVLFLLTPINVQLSSADGSVYNALSIALMLIAAGSLVLSCWQVRLLWHSLQGFLTCLNTLPLGSAFVSVDRSGSSRPIWVRRLTLQSIDIHASALVVLHDMTILRPEWEEGKTWLSSYRNQIESLVGLGPVQTRSTRLITREGIRQTSQAIAVEAFRIAREEWITHPLVKHFEPDPAGAEEKTYRTQALLEIDGDPANIADLAATFAALHYSPFLMYGVRQIRNLMLFLSVGFLLLVISMSSYSHQSPQFIGRFLIVLFILIGAVTWTALTGMERDPILSRMTGTTPGKLTLESYVKVVGYAALPIIGLLASQFPSISNFLYSWIAPTLEALQ